MGFGLELGLGSGLGFGLGLGLGLGLPPLHVLGEKHTTCKTLGYTLGI